MSSGTALSAEQVRDLLVAWLRAALVERTSGGGHEEASTGPKLLLSPEEAADLLSCSRSMVYTLIGRGELRAIKLGTARRIPRQSLDAFIERQLAEALENEVRA